MLKQVIILSVLLTLIPVFTKAQLVLHSGYQNGSYYKIANDLKSVVENKPKIDTIKVSKNKVKYDTIVSEFLKVKTSDGSVQNYRKLIKANANQMVLMQQDVLTFQELMDLKDGTNNTEDIRVLLTLGLEKVHLITYKKSKINSLSDLKRKKVGIGIKNEGTHFTALQLKKLTKINWVGVEIPVVDGFSALLNGEIDAFFLVGADPVHKLQFMSEEMKKYFRLVPIEHEALKEDYKETVIKKNTYDWVKEDVKTFGVNLLLLNRVAYVSETDKKQLKKFLTQIRENYKVLADTRHPNFKEIDFNMKYINKLKVSSISKSVFGVE